MMTNLDFLADGGELAALIAAFDWKATSLGSPDRWPQSLRTTASTILQSPVSIVMHPTSARVFLM
jgi:hypothetical protein